MVSHSPATPGGPAPEAPEHRPVLLHPLISSLQPQPGQVVVDGTLGGGGVTAALAELVAPGGRVIALDRDPVAVARARERFGSPAGTVTVELGNFADLEEVVARVHQGPVDAVTLDLGISSIQLDDPARGFAFRSDGPLDMRMDQNSGGETAADILATWEASDLIALLRTYGGERIHPATRTFQALRIEVNQELAALEQGMQAAIRILRPGGRLGVISFHSLEDTLVKNALHVAAQNCLCPPQQPLCTCAHRASLHLISRRAITPDDAEVLDNPRARSAKLRVAEHL
jgi:16S rRNA (cytosine1402-N4)-methyltransferase